MCILVCRHARFRGCRPLPPRQPMAAMLPAGRDVIVELRLGARPLLGSGGGPQTAWAACPKSHRGHWAGQRTSTAPHARRRKGRWPVHVATTTSAESRSLVLEAHQDKTLAVRASAGKRLPGRASRVRCGRLVGHQRREIFCPAQRVVWLPRVKNDSGAALWEETCRSSTRRGRERAAPTG